jgi:hypothetical protein
MDKASAPTTALSFPKGEVRRGVRGVFAAGVLSAFMGIS